MERGAWWAAVHGGHKIVRYTWVTKQQQQKVTRKRGTRGLLNSIYYGAFSTDKSWVLLLLIQARKHVYKWKFSLQKEAVCPVFPASVVLKIIHMPKRHILGWRSLISFSTFQLQNLVRIESSHFQHQVEWWEVEAEVLIALLCWLEWVFSLYISWLYSMKRIFPH